jgi:hypothetical protein
MVIASGLSYVYADTLRERTRKAGAVVELREDPRRNRCGQDTVTNYTPVVRSPWRNAASRGTVKASGLGAAGVARRAQEPRARPIQRATSPGMWGVR